MTVELVSNAAITMFRAADGYNHHVHRWAPEGEPRATVLWLHGIQSHAGWYRWSSNQLAASGYDVRILDRRGSGLNEQDRGHAPSAERLISDVTELLTMIGDERKRISAKSPIVLAGLSWGAKLAASVAARHAELIDGLLLAYPGIRTYFEPRGWQRAAIRTLCSLGVGRRLVPVPLSDPELFTDSPEHQQAMREDARALHRVSLSFLKATLDLTAHAERAPLQITLPSLLLLAGRDQIGNSPAMREWAQRIAGETTLIMFPQARHTLEFDRDRDKYVAAVSQWIQSIR